MSDESEEFRRMMNDAPPYVTVFEDGDEIWKSFTDWNATHYSQYIVSNKGRVAKVTKTGMFKRINCGIIRGKYLNFRLSGVIVGEPESEQVSYSLANVVAKMFIPNPYNSRKVDYKDGDTLNCSADNLEWHVTKYAKLMKERGLI